MGGQCHKYVCRDNCATPEQLQRYTLFFGLIDENLCIVHTFLSFCHTLVSPCPSPPVAPPPAASCPLQDNNTGQPSRALSLLGEAKMLDES